MTNVEMTLVRIAEYATAAGRLLDRAVQHVAGSSTAILRVGEFPAVSLRVKFVVGLNVGPAEGAVVGANVGAFVGDAVMGTHAADELALGGYTVVSPTGQNWQEISASGPP